MIDWYVAPKSHKSIWDWFDWRQHALYYCIGGIVGLITGMALAHFVFIPILRWVFGVIHDAYPAFPLYIG